MTERFARHAFRDVERVGRALVVASPRHPAPRLDEVARTLVERARGEGLRARLFGLPVPALRRAGLQVVAVGREPLWRPEGWLARSGRRGSLREQVRRAERKGLRLRWHEGAPPEEALALAERWLATRGMAPMGFCVRLRLGGDPMLLGERDGRLVAVAQLRPLPEWDGWIVEHLLRDPEAAPNGWAEATLQQVALRARAHGVPWISLGLAPLHGPGVPPWMRLLGRAGRPLFDFEGLAAFKARLRPDRWVRRGLGHRRGEPSVLAVLDTLRAFAGGSLLRFGLHTAAHRLRAARPTPRPPRLGPGPRPPCPGAERR